MRHREESGTHVVCDGVRRVDERLSTIMLGVWVARLVLDPSSVARARYDILESAEYKCAPP